MYGPDRLRNCLHAICGDCCVDASNIKFKDDIVEARPAPDPENIIWENFHVTKCQSFLR